MHVTIVRAEVKKQINKVVYLKVIHLIFCPLTPLALSQRTCLQSHIPLLTVRNATRVTLQKGIIKTQRVFINLNVVSETWKDFNINTGPEPTFEEQS